MPASKTGRWTHRSGWQSEGSLLTRSCLLQEQHARSFWWSCVGLPFEQQLIKWHLHVIWLPFFSFFPSPSIRKADRDWPVSGGRKDGSLQSRGDLWVRLVRWYGPGRWWRETLLLHDGAARSSPSIWRVSRRISWPYFCPVLNLQCQHLKVPAEHQGGEVSCLLPELLRAFSVLLSRVFICLVTNAVKSGFFHWL